MSLTTEKRIFHKIDCKKCDMYLCDAIEGSLVMCPKCNVWMTSGKEEKPKVSKKD